MNRPSKTRVLLADDHGILRVGVRKLISARSWVQWRMAGPSSRRRALLQPDLILDSSMPLLNISIKTVQFHKTCLMQDLDRASRLRRALSERLC